MPKVTHVKSAQQRYEMVPALDARTGEQIVTAVSRTTKTGRAVTMRRTVPDRTRPLPPHDCDYCRELIAVGTPYKHITPKSGPYGGTTRRRHESCPAWQPWDYSDSLSAQLARIAHEFETALGEADSTDDVESALSEAAEAAREIAEAKRESAAAIEEGFQHPTAQSGELNDIADQLDDWAAGIENISVPDFPEPEETDCDECGSTGRVETDESAPATEPCEACSGTGTVTPEEPTEDQVDEWRSAVESETPAVGEPPV